jgi:tetratricopeptide (TPR) repeat protein/cellulose biosynthesis protein BcsQ
MALANVAWILAANGYRVLTVDWDLESPGLHRYFHPFLRDKGLHETDGVIDMVRRFSDAMLTDDHQVDIAELADFREFAVSLEWDFGTGRLDFIGAGRQGPQYSTIVSTFGWDAFWLARGSEFFDELQEQMRGDYDFVLIDSRTGLSDTAGICTVQLPDTVVTCFTLNTQSIDGSAAVARSIARMHEARGRPAARILPVPTRVEDGEQRRLERGRAYAYRSFAQFLAQPGITDPDEYWGSVELPYRAYYAYEEILATFGDQPRLENSLLAPYVRLARWISGAEVSAPVIDEGVRQRVLRTFERSDPVDPSRVLINYVPLDRVYAEWLAEQLARIGHTPLLHFAGDELPDVDAFDRVAVLVSRDYETFPENYEFAKALQRRDGTEEDFAVVVQTASVPMPADLRRYPNIDLTRVGADRAMEQVLDSLQLQPDATARSSYEEVAEGIRYPRVQARYWNLQLVRNASFSGRHRLLEALRSQLLAADSADGGRIALEGINGVGKTQIALEYAYRFAATYDIVWWISAEQTDRVRTNLAELAERLGIPGDAEERVVAVREMLRQGKPSPRWLIVLDNADAPEELHDFLPTSTGHIIITSRNPHWTEKYHIPRLDVDVFARGESVELLQRRVRRLPNADADRIADALGDLPLALEQAAAWLALTGSTTADYLTELNARTARVLDQQAPPNQPSTTASVRLSFDRLRQESPAAARLLQLFAFLAPEAIPFRLLESERLSDYLTELDPTMHDPLLQRTLISVIGRYALARVNTATGGAVVHRLTQGIIRDGLEDEQQKAIRDELWRILASVKRGDREDSDNWPLYEELRAHLETSGAIDASRPDVRILFLYLAAYLRYRGDYISAEDLVARVHERWLELHGEDDTLTMRLLSERGNIARARGHVKRAYDIDRDVVERMTRILGEAHAYTLIAAGGLAASMRTLGEFARARDLDEQTAPRMRDVLGPNNDRTLMERNNLAISLRLTGEFTQALLETRDVLETAGRVLTKNDYRITFWQDNFAGHLRAVGRQREARERLEEVLGRQRAVAPDAIQTWRIAANLAGVLRLTGDGARGRDVAEEAYARLTAVAGPQHPETIAAELELACAQWWLGRVEEGRKHAQRVYDFYRDRRGPKHPFTLITAADLAMIERANGDLTGSRGRADEAANGLKNVLGPAHPHTLIAQMSTATARFRVGEMDEAYAIDQEVHRRLAEQLGDRHPTTLAAEVNLALSTRERRDGPQARGELPRVQERCAEILGTSHPYTVAAADVRRIDVDIELLPT